MRFGEMTLFIVQTSGILLLVMLSLLILFLIAPFLFRIGHGTYKLLKSRSSASWIHINSDISISFDGGKTYTKNYSYVNMRRETYIKYEISTKTNGVLSSLHRYGISFTLQSNMSISLHEFNGICKSESAKKTKISEMENGLYLKEDVKHSFVVAAAKGKSKETSKMILKCTPKSGYTFFALRMDFSDKCLKPHSNIIALEFKGI